ncbi:coelenterazine h 2-monooxygenase-like [Amphiura filiformis]|uniref:coelenterazine h 2-monooxygenase-like n=1 Tax=Amphiura filiformis TaxID=82378 RepID=UPI003B21322D
MASSDALNRLQVVAKHFEEVPTFRSVVVNHVLASPTGVHPTSTSAGITSKSATEWWGKCRRINILDCDMSYYDSDPAGKSKNAVIFLHGNPTSSFLWRNIIPHVEPVARCLAPDLIGQGRSSKRVNHSYRFVDHYRYLSEWFDSVNLPEKVTFVVHDWGSGLGFHWCHMHPDRVAAIIHMESVVGSMQAGWEVFPEHGRKDFQALRTEAGEQMVLKNNFFVEKYLPATILRNLSEDEMNAYREPFANPGEDRRPTLTWPREIPVEGDGPEDVINIANDYFEWFCGTNDIPKLFIDGEPGYFSPLIRRVMEFWPNQETVRVKGLHFLQEDSPKEIGDAIRAFLLKKVLN